jgi:hypothetical protein
MNRNRTIVIVLLVALLAVCCCVATIAGVVLMRGLGDNGLSFTPDWVSATQTFNRTVDVRTPATLNVDVAVGDITIRAGSGQQVTVNATKRAWSANSAQANQILDRIEISVEPSGNRVDVRVSGMDQFRTLGRSPQVNLVITVPAETALDLTSRVGNLRVTGLRGAVNISADVGDVRLTDVTPVGQLSVETRVASIELDGALAANAAYSLTSDVGRIAVRLPTGSAFKLDARSDIGDVRVDFVLTGSSRREGLVSKEVRGEVGANPTASLTLRSRVGEISVRPN